MMLLYALALCALTSCPKEKPEVDVQTRLRQTFASEEYAVAYRTKRLLADGPFARLIIRKLGVDLIVAEGVTGEALRAGAGHYPTTSFPGDVGNTAIAGMRVGEAKPFRRLNEMTEGDEVILIVPGKRFVYGVIPSFGGHDNPWRTTPNDLSTLAPTDYAALTLTTSDPPETSMNRLILRLRLTRSEDVR